MKRRERLISSIQGKPVDRPPVSFYEINGFDENTEQINPFNIFSHPSWLPLIELAREKTDRILMRDVPLKNALPDPLDELTTLDVKIDSNGTRFTRRLIKTNTRILSSTTRHDPDINTVWDIEHMLKDLDDLKAYLSLPLQEFSGEPDTSGFIKTEQALGDTGIVMIDTPDPLCIAASLFHMADFTVFALKEPLLFHQLLERFAQSLIPKIVAVAKALPGRLWRIFGPEYASPPYLPPRLFREYAVRYNIPMIEAIKKYGGYPRIHCHGRIKDIIKDIASTGCTGLDPIEPPPQGDIDLLYVRQTYGQQMTLFGNLEASDIETLPTQQFEKKVIRALREGTYGEGRGFILMPSASPYGRILPTLAMKNYEKIIEIIEKF